MKPENESAAWGCHPGGAEDQKSKLSRSQYNATGRYAWRRDRGLLTIGDLTRRYLARRRPVGPYFTPLPADLIEWRREVTR